MRAACLNGEAARFISVADFGRRALRAAYPWGLAGPHSRMISPKHCRPLGMTAP